MMRRSMHDVRNSRHARNVHHAMITTDSYADSYRLMRQY
jgi:hypothetical protein